MIRRLAFAVLVLMAIAGLAAVFPASAHPGSVNHTWGHLKPKVVNMHPWAVVDADGSLVDGSGVASTSQAGQGAYDVDFERDISNCSFVATSRVSGRFVTMNYNHGSDGVVGVNSAIASTGSLDSAGFVVQGSCS